jgi:hypothetical protein
MTPNQILVQVGSEKAVLSLRRKPHKVIQRFAQRHAEYMARLLTSGHQHWAKRREQLIKAASDAIEFVEVCVASRDWNTKPRPAAIDIFDSWRQSPGHWSVVNGGRSDELMRWNDSKLPDDRNRT